MSFLSSVFGNNNLKQKPYLTFSDPNPQGYIRAINASNQEVAHFIVSGKSISRVSGTVHRQICTFKRSSLSGTITLQLHGQEIKIKQSWEGMRYGKDVQSPTGILKWRPGSSGFQELRDTQKTLLARCRFPGTLRKKSGDLEVFVPGDEFFLDLMLASWVSTVKSLKKENEETKAAMEIAEALAAV